MEGEPLNVEQYKKLQEKERKKNAHSIYTAVSFMVIVFCALANIAGATFLWAYSIGNDTIQVTAPFITSIVFGAVYLCLFATYLIIDHYKQYGEVA